MEPCQFTAVDALALLRQRKLSCEELVRSCLGRIQQRDHLTRAWQHVDSGLVIREARELDKCPPTGVMHGIPFGVKDVIDTAEYPTTQNSPIYHDLRVGRDAGCVALMKACGALVLGKTDTVEFASSGRKALTRNPHDFDHTPGGSSSGSGAAVADFMVPIALGTQTGGSLVRPAAYNGIYGMKPSWNRVSSNGVRVLSSSLDTVGWYGRCIQDLALVSHAFHFKLHNQRIVVRGLRVALCRTPMWSEIEPAGADALHAVARRLSDNGAIVEELSLPPRFAELGAAHAAIYNREAGVAFLPEYVTHSSLLAAGLKAKVENAKGISDEVLLESYATADECRRAFGPYLRERNFDVVMAPAAPGEAPSGLQNTGSSVFNALWTLLHVPCIAVPAGRGPAGLPVGVQLIGPQMSDSMLLAIAEAVSPIIDSGRGAGVRELLQ